MTEKFRPVSVIVVSRGRPERLALCLLGIEQQFYPNFEVIVVADPDGVRAVREMDWDRRVKLVPFDEQNISAARNAGINAAAGEIVAFVDDDAVPEPTWLRQLASAFDEERAVAAGGFVHARDGISYQSEANLVNYRGEDVPLDIWGEGWFLPIPPEGHAVKTEGTNCAFRREIVSDLGGFDPLFRYYLDDADLNMRIAQAGYETAMVPRAQVHHGRAASSRRAGDMTPKSLFEIGASQAVFLRKYAPSRERNTILEAFHDAHRKRLLKFMVAGGLEPGDIARLMEDLSAGFAEGDMREIGKREPLKQAPENFLPFRRADATGRSSYVAGRSWSRNVMAQVAQKKVARGDVVTVLSLSPTARAHRMRFRPEGYWEQRGGLFGRAGRTDAPFQFYRFSQRARKESQRIANERQIAQKPG